MGARIINNVINQLGAPSIFESALASFPAAGQPGRLLVATDTFALYRDNGTGFDLIGGPGTGTITGSGTIGKIVKFNGTSVIGDSIINQIGTVITVTGSVSVTTNITVSGTGIVGFGGINQYVQGDSVNNRLYFGAGGGANIILFPYNAGKIGQFTSSNSSTGYWEFFDANANLSRGFLGYGTGIFSGASIDDIVLRSESSLKFAANGNNLALTINTDLNANFVGNITALSIIRSGGTSAQFLKADGSVDSNTYLTTSGAVTSITGTADQILVSAATGDVTLSLPQSIATTSNVTFGSASLSNSTNYLTLKSINANTGYIDLYYNTNTLAGYIGNGSGILSGAIDSDFIIRSESALKFATGGNTLAFIITSSQVITAVSRVNVNGAIDNANFALNVSGCTYTNSFSPTASIRTTSWNAGDNTTYIFTGAAGQTATMENPATTNKIIIIKNFSANSLTVAGYSANSIIDNTNTAVSSFILTTGKTVIMQQDGGSKTIILSIY